MKKVMFFAALCVLVSTQIGCVTKMFSKHDSKTHGTRWFLGKSHIGIIYADYSAFHKMNKSLMFSEDELKRVHSRLGTYWNHGDNNYSEDGKKYYMMGYIYYSYAKLRMSKRKGFVHRNKKVSADHDFRQMFWRLREAAGYLRKALEPCGWKDRQTKTTFRCNRYPVAHTRPMLRYIEKVIKRLKYYRSMCKPKKTLVQNCQNGTLRSRKVCKNPINFYIVYCDNSTK